MDTCLRYDSSAAAKLLPENAIASIVPSLEAARKEVAEDVTLWNSGNAVPTAKIPLDAGFIELPKRLLSELERKGDDSEIARIEACAKRLREETDRVVLLGIGGSYMGARALFEALCHPWHNELSRVERNGIPRVYFEGNNVDNDVVSALLQMLPVNPVQNQRVENRWSMVCISKSGGTLETAISFRLFRNAIERFYSDDRNAVQRLVVPVTGLSGKLRDITNAQGYVSHFPIPDGVGGRFSIFTAVGLLPAAILGLDIRSLLRGAAKMTEVFFSAAAGANPVLDYTAVCHAFENRGCDIRILSTWGKRLEAAGLWYDQLLSESLGKEERGATPITVVNTRDLHSRGQQHQEGVRNKLITNVFVEQSASAPVTIPQVGDDLDGLDRYTTQSVSDVLRAAFNGTNLAYANASRPTADLMLPVLNEHTLGQFFQMMMLATVLEGRLIGINPYGQPGVEAYKKETVRLLSQ